MQTILYLGKGANFYLEIPTKLVNEKNINLNILRMGGLLRRSGGAVSIYEFPSSEERVDGEIKNLLKFLTNNNISYYDDSRITSITEYKDDYFIVRGNVLEGERGEIFDGGRPFSAKYVERPPDGGTAAFILDRENAENFAVEMNRWGKPLKIKYLPKKVVSLEKVLSPRRSTTPERKSDSPPKTLVLSPLRQESKSNGTVTINIMYLDNLIGKVERAITDNDLNEMELRGKLSYVLMQLNNFKGSS